MTSPCVETDAPRAGYRPCVGLFLLGPDNRVFVGQRHDMAEPAWQMPQGGIDRSETAVEAGRREMLEEIGTDRAELLAESRCWRSYDLPAPVAAERWRGRHRGQCQKWLAYRFTGADADIRIDLPHAEFRAWRWVAPDELALLIVPFKRAVYLSVVAEFRPLWA
ncbi:MAG: RNA pyrophosphohydrolase [Geminicoccaceae bacterium]